MQFLAIDTSTESGSVALYTNNGVSVNFEVNIDRSHSGALLPMVDSVLKIAKISVTELDFLAITSGPGSYTGLRIGAATIKALAIGWGKSVMAVDTLTIMASQAKRLYKPNIIIAMLDARRMEAYAGVFNQNLDCLVPTQPTILDTNTFSEYVINPNCFLVGNGATKFYNILPNTTKPMLAPNIMPSAQNLALYIADNPLTHPLLNPEDFTPNYNKEFYTTAKKIE